MAFTNLDATLFDSEGYVLVQWDDVGQSGSYEAYRVYARDLSLGTDWVLLFQTIENESTYEYRDYIAPANRNLEYAVVEVTVGNVEGGFDDTLTVTPVGTNYWLVADFDTSLNFRLEHVTSDSFTDEYEEETFGLIGRGRKKEVGTRWGYSGSLGAQIRPKNGKSGIEQKAELEAIKRRQGEGDIYIRTPFGDVVKASLGPLGWQRLSDSGTASWFTVDIPYEEVY